MVSHPIKVLIVEDSTVAAELLAHIINSDPNLKVIGHVENGEAALEFINKETPDVITMDIVMPRMDGFEATRRIMQIKPIPIIIISGIYKKDDLSKSFQAIEAGALEILEKPISILDSRYHQIAEYLIRTIKTVAEVKLITRRYSKEKAQGLVEEKIQIKKWLGVPEAIGIGSSLGGPQALQLILSEMPSFFPIPIFIVQHISSGFTKGFVDWLADHSPLKVHIAEHLAVAQPGHIYVAPDNKHMGVSKGNVINLVDSFESNKLRPSVGHLFRSMAETYGPNSIGVILTGMGKDGSEELLLMKKKGAMTIAQDKDGCIMFGMPKEAISIGAASLIVPLSEIAHTLTLLVFPQHSNS